MGSYSNLQRRIETIGIAVFFCLLIWLAVELADDTATRPGLILLAIVTGMFLSDFGAGLVHWAADTWGTPEWFIVGPAFIRPFREHHYDEKAITRHDFVETNGSNCFVAIPVVATAIHMASPPDPMSFWSAAMGSMCFWVFGTNQFHKWAHMDTRPKLVQWLQRLGLILSCEHHKIHHTYPFDRYYCITTGWMNPLLTRLHFFRFLELIIQKMTKAVPRQDDLATVAATAVKNAAAPLLPTENYQSPEFPSYQSSPTEY